MVRILSAATMIALTTIVANASNGYPFPADATPIDITKPPYNAVGDGKTDCTAAFNTALKAGKAQGFNTGGQRLIYVPDGIYLIRCTPEEAQAAREQKYLAGLVDWQGSKKTILHGQSRDKTIIKLADNCPGFEDARRPRMVVDAGKAGSNDFSNSVYNITVDTGVGNPGAIGMKFHTSNQGGMFNVTIRSGDPQKAGRIGLDLRANGPGPQLIKNLRIEGFDRGISVVYDGGFDTVFEHVELIDQREAGVYNESLPMAIRGLKTRGSVPAVCLAGPSAYLALIDADLRYVPPATQPTTQAATQSSTQPTTSSAKAPSAIVNDTGCLYVRNATCDGFSSAIRSKVDNTTRVAHGPKIDEWVSHPVRTAIPSAVARSLELPIEETPEPDWGDRLEPPGSTCSTPETVRPSV